MSLPRKTVSEMDWDGAKIPPKTMILINAQAANHDVEHFGLDAGTFNPERWLTFSDKHVPQEIPAQGIQHFSFGAGSRACSGQHIASRLLYIALIRILSCYKIVASEGMPPNTDYVEYNAIKSALVAIPRDFRVRLVPREGIDIGGPDGVLREAEVRTEGYYAE
jgi:phenylacetate 2-hydroxylase